MSAQPVRWIPVGNAVPGQRLAAGPKPWPEILERRELADEYEVSLQFGKRTEVIRVAKDQEIPVEAVWRP